MEYTKDFKERDELLDQLVERGLEGPGPTRCPAVPDPRWLLSLGSVPLRSGASCCRLSKSTRSFGEFRSDRYVAGASFDHVVQLEAFDFKLARVCLEGLLDFEVRVRAAIAHTLAARDISAHTRIDCLDERMCSRPAKDGTKFEAWMETCEAAITAAAEDEDFIAHHLLKYPEQPVPIWALTEALSFGKLPFLFELMKTEDAREVARSFGFEHPRPFGAVLRMMVDLRNTCAHGSRLFNRAFKRSPLPEGSRDQGRSARPRRG